jgi:hypothetical protein
LFVSYLLISECAADSSDTTVGPEDPKDDEVVPKVEEATKPQEGKNVTRRATTYKAQKEVQPGQVTVAPEAMATVEGEELATAKRRRRRSARSKVRVAARKGQKGEVQFSLLLINSCIFVIAWMLVFVFLHLLLSNCRFRGDTDDDCF